MALNNQECLNLWIFNMADLEEFPEGEIDYEMPNSYFISDDEKKKRFLNTIKGLTLHVMHNMTDAGMEMAKDAPIENDRFNSNLDIPTLFDNSDNRFISRLRRR